MALGGDLPADETVRTGRSRSPLELGLEWLVDFKKPVFNGRRALLEEKEKGSRYALVKLATDLWQSFGVPPQQATRALMPLPPTPTKWSQVSLAGVTRSPPGRR